MSNLEIFIIVILSIQAYLVMLGLTWIVTRKSSPDDMFTDSRQILCTFSSILWPLSLPLIGGIWIAKNIKLPRWTSMPRA